MGDPTESNLEDHWIDFLVAWKGTYTKVQQAAKDTPQELQWFGGRNTQRKSDQVLQYLFQARNDEEHGLVKSASLEPGRAVFRMTKDGPDPQLVFENNRPAKIVDATGEVIAELLAQQAIVAELHAVKDRSGNVIPPPAALDGSPLNPVTVADLGLRYLEALIAKAEAMSKPEEWA